MRQRDTAAAQSRYRQHFPVVQVNRIDSLNTIGHQSIGRASATVFYKEDQSDWGLLDQRPVGVLTFHTDPVEPHGYKLRSLEVRLSFSDYANPSGASSSRNGVKILQRPSPRKIKGGETVQPVERNWNLNPQVPTPIGGVTVGNIGQKSNFERKGYWTYESHMASSQRTAIWIWSANDANSANEDTGDLHGAVVLNHAGDDFFVSCTIEGKLVNRTSDFIWSARKWFKIRSRTTTANESYLRITPRAGSQIDLKQVVDGLEQKMQDLMKQSSASKEIRSVTAQKEY